VRHGGKAPDCTLGVRRILSQVSSPDHALRPRLLIVLCWAAMMSLAIGLNLLPLCLISLSRSFGGAHGLDKEQLGRLGAIAFVGVVSGVLVCGPLADRLGAKLFALGGCVLIAIGLILVACAPAYGYLGAGCLVLGLGSGMLDMVLSPVVAALVPERRSAAMNLLHSFYCIGAAVTLLIGALALHAGIGWRGIFLLLLPLPVVTAVSFMPLSFPKLVTSRGRTPFRALVNRRYFQIALVVIFLGGATELGLAQWLPAYAETTLHYAPWVGGAALLGFSVAMAVGRIVAGIIGNRCDPYAILIVSAASSVALMLLGAFIPSASVALGACILAGFTGSCLWPTVLAVVADRYPDGGAIMFAALGALGNAGGIVMPWMVGMLGDHYGLRIGLGTCALAPLVMLALVVRLRPLTVTPLAVASLPAA
jgi:MFS family permease